VTRFRRRRRTLAGFRFAPRCGASSQSGHARDADFSSDLRWINAGFGEPAKKGGIAIAKRDARQ